MSQPYPSRRPSESTMAAYHTVAFAQNQAAIRETAIREHDGRLPQSPSHRTRQPSERRPSESAMAVYHAEPLTTQEPLRMDNTALRMSNHVAGKPKPDNRFPRERHPPKRKPPFTHLMAEYRTPPTPEGHETPW